MSSLITFVKRNDINCFYFINRKLRCRIMSFFMAKATYLGSTPFVLAFSTLFALLDRQAGLILAANVTSGQVLIQLLKRVVNRPRPYTAHDWVVAVKPPKCRYSFPSGHTNSAFAIALTLSAFFPGLGAAILILAAAVGISRIYLGFHYPTDVSVGFLLSFVVFELSRHMILR